MAKISSGIITGWGRFRYGNRTSWESVRSLKYVTSLAEVQENKNVAEKNRKKSVIKEPNLRIKEN
jgi:hypothetical protein